MSEAGNDEGKPIPLLCGCGRKLRYSHLKDGEEVMSCNKYAVCLTYDEQFELIRDLQRDLAKYKAALERVAGVSAMDYEYRAWAKEALTT